MEWFSKRMQLQLTCISWSHRKATEYIHTIILNHHPALQAASKSLEILLPVHAAVDLLFFSNETAGHL